MSIHSRLILLWLVLFATAMAYVEAILVVHLRSLYYPADPLNIFPLNLLTHRDLAIELGREAATILMILSIAVVAQKSLARRFAAFIFVFGLWDLGYYFWLKLLIDWPLAWLEWDVLFLIPWPWFGPWITAAAIAMLFVIWSGYVLASPSEPRFSRLLTGLFLLGAVIGVIAFLWPAVPMLVAGEEAFREFYPSDFPWFTFGIGYLLMLTGLLGSLRTENDKDVR